MPEVLQVVAGVPVTLQEFSFKIGGKFKIVGKPGTRNASTYAKDFITTTSCPKSNKYPYEATAFYEYQDGTTSSKKYASTVPCS